jgi:hypothetical protein
MRIAYWTTDEVNADLAVRIGAAVAVDLDLCTPRDAAANGRYDAVVYDWDYLPSKQQRDLLAELLGCPLRCPVALHSYALEDTLTAALRERGVAVFHRLQPELFLLLQRMAGADHAPSHPSRGRDTGVVIQKASATSADGRARTNDGERLATPEVG